MGIARMYICPICSATKTILDGVDGRPPVGEFPENVPCGWRGCKGIATPAVAQIKQCMKCSTRETTRFWKCCSKHTTSFGPDVYCDDCAHEMHPELLIKGKR